MSNNQNNGVPLGVKIIVAWTALAGIALIILGYANSPMYYLWGLCMLIGAYGLWNMQLWGIIFALIGYGVEGVLSILNVEIVEFLLVTVVLLYIGSQHRRFSRTTVPVF